jgi:hypothetical protein
MDVCSFFDIVDSKPVGSAANGTLYSVSVRQRENDYKTRDENDDHEYDRASIKTGKPETTVSFAFCSKTQPLQHKSAEPPTSQASGSNLNNRCSNSVRESLLNFILDADVVSARVIGDWISVPCFPPAARGDGNPGQGC